MQDHHGGARRFVWGKWSVVLLLVCFLLVSMLFQKGFELAFTDTGMALTLPDRTEYFVPFEDMEEIEYITPPDYGSAVSGAVSGKFSYGTWENDTWGVYCLAVYNKIDSCIVIHTSSAVYAVNFESQDATASIYDALLKLT